MQHPSYLFHTDITLPPALPALHSVASTGCRAITLPAAPTSASVPASCDNAQPGSTCTATCPAGFDGSPSIACNSGNAWAASWSGECTDRRVWGCAVHRGHMQDCKRAARHRACCWCELGALRDTPKHPLKKHATPHPLLRTQGCTGPLPTLPSNAELPPGGCSATLPGASCTAKCPSWAPGTPTLSCNAGSWAPQWAGACVPSSEATGRGGGCSPAAASSLTWGVGCLAALGSKHAAQCEPCQRPLIQAAASTHPPRCPRTAPPNTACNGVMPAAPANAIVSDTCNGLVHGAKCLAACPAGFVGTPTLECSSGQWAASWTGACVDQRASRVCTGC